LRCCDSLAETDVVTFMPEDNTAAALTRFEANGVAKDARKGTRRPSQ